MRASRAVFQGEEKKIEEKDHLQPNVLYEKRRTITHSQTSYSISSEFLFFLFSLFKCLAPATPE